MDWKAGLDSAFSDLFGRRNVLLLAASWFGGLVILAVYGTISTNPTKPGTSLSAALPVLKKNETGAFVAWRRDSDAGYRPAYKVAFDNLRAENGRLGLFRTASHKVVHIDNLHIEFLQTAESRNAEQEGSIQLGDFCSLFAPPNSKNGGTGLLGVFQELQAERGQWSVSMDMTNATEVQIRHLDWEIRRDDETVFRARCMRACLHGGSRHVILRGHATVTANGTTLESNCIRLDVQNERLVVDGRYVLTRDGQRQFGAGTCFDTHLIPLKTKS